ncbi:MAG TPA: acyltransferase [Rhizomicrobium sp.]|jgi:peptidoglycan/LPS O-acetylase OafA/YrhL|nr:acyltransferase [Rhizomicrobium sp.]
MRLSSLEAVRGLAALLVVLHHWIFAFTAHVPVQRLMTQHRYAELLRQTIADFSTLGPAAVLVFFVMSGFVLTLSLDRGDRSYREFIASRFIRLYPPFVFAILLSALLVAVIDPRPVPHLSSWFNEFWTMQPSAALIAGHLAMIGTVRLEGLDSVMWSLVHEMRIALFLPLIAISVRRAMWPSLCLALLVSLLAQTMAVNASPVAESWLMTAYYACLFFAGSALALNIDRIRSWWMRRSGLTRAALWVVTILFICIPDQIGERWIVYTIGLGAIGVVMLCASDVFAGKMLSNGALQYFGKISYSLYLTHWPVMLTMLHLFYGKAPTWVVILATAAIIIAVAHITWALIERPCQKLSHHLFSRRMTCTESLAYRRAA